jgi:hypothetical protein
MRTLWTKRRVVDLVPPLTAAELEHAIRERLYGERVFVERRQSDETQIALDAERATDDD